MIRGIWTAQSIAWLIVAALLPALVVVLIEQGLQGAFRIAVSLGAIGFWQLVFAVVRGQPMSPAGSVAAVAVAVLAPGEISIGQLVLALTFGTVIGELIFGGWGRNVLSSAVVALAFLYFSFPETQHDPAGIRIVLASVPAAILLLVTGILSVRVLFSAIAALVAVTFLLGEDASVLLTQGSLAFGLVFLVGDPVTSASTNPGRWLYGGLSGALAGLFGWAGAGFGAPQTIVYAALLASIFAPLIDHGVIATMGYLRRPDHG